MQLAFTDQLGEKIQLNKPPERVISLVPSQTELLYALGLDQEVKGITKFCVHPGSWFQTKIKVGGTKDFNFDIIDSLDPDLILGNKEENYREGIDRLRDKYPVWMSDIVTLDDAMRMIAGVGVMVGKKIQAEEIIHKIKTAFSHLRHKPPLRTLYLIWRNPWMGVGKGTFVNSMLETQGLINVLLGDRYPKLSEQEIAELSPDLILLSSEPFPFKEKHQRELAALIPNAKIVLVDGEMFSWYGSRLVNSPTYFNSLEF